VDTNVSEKHAVSIFRAEGLSQDVVITEKNIDIFTALRTSNLTLLQISKEVVNSLISKLRMKVQQYIEQTFKTSNKQEHVSELPPPSVSIG
jgi:hypothetical protein